MTEPTLEELSAYLDHELEATAQSRIAEHVAGCAGCQARLDGLRQTAYAIRALPMETPPRTFTVPAAREQRGWRWAPAGWIGGVAVAMLVVVIGVTHLNFGGPAGTGAGTTAPNAPQNHSTLSQPYAAATRAAAPGVGAATQADQAIRAVNQVRVVDPLNPAQMMSVSTDSRAYSANGLMTIQIYYYGFTPAQVPPVRVFLERNGYAVELTTPSQSTGQAGGIQGQYALSTLTMPRTGGTYTLTVIQSLPEGSGETLVAHLTITVSG